MATTQDDDSTEFTSSFADQFAPAGLQNARGLDEKRKAATAIVTAPLRHEENDHCKLKQLAEVLHTHGLLSWGEFEACSEIDTNTTREAFAALVAKVQAALSRLPLEVLEQLARESFTEDESPPMQFGGDGDRAAPKEPADSAAVMAKAQLRGSRNVPVAPAAMAMAKKQVANSAHAKRS
jgi:hypothetical protein